MKTVPYVKTIGYCYGNHNIIYNYKDDCQYLVLKPSSILSSVLLASGKQYVLQVIILIFCLIFYRPLKIAPIYLRIKRNLFPALKGTGIDTPLSYNNDPNHLF